MTKASTAPPLTTLEAVIDSIPTQIWQMSYDCTYGRVNAAHAAFLGKTREQIELQPLESVLPPGEAASAITLTRNAFDAKHALETEQWRPDAAGKRRLLRVTMTPTTDAASGVQFLSCTAEDITAQWEAERELQLCRESIDDQVTQ